MSKGGREELMRGCGSIPSKRNYSREIEIEIVISGAEHRALREVLPLCLEVNASFHEFDSLFSPLLLPFPSPFLPLPFPSQ